MPSKTDKEEKKVFKCEECQKKFKRKENLKNHISIHIGHTEKLTCPECDKQFKNKTNIRVHFKSHHGEFDSKMLEKKATLKPVKKVTHKHQQIFTCKMKTITGKICGKSFTRNERLKYHEQHYHEESPMKLFLHCNHGKIAFASKSNMLKHVANFHKLKTVDQEPPCNETKVVHHKFEEYGNRNKKINFFRKFDLIPSTSMIIKKKILDKKNTSAAQKKKLKAALNNMDNISISSEAHTMVSNGITQNNKNVSNKRSHVKVQQKIFDFCNKNHSANFSLKGLPEYPVCHSCLQGSNVVKCAGKCNDFFHQQCLNKVIKESEYNVILKEMQKNKQETSTTESPLNIGNSTHNSMCISCVSSSSMRCFVCKKSDTDCIECSHENCGKTYHMPECFKYWPQHKTLYTQGILKSLYCPRHVCHTCISSDIQRLFRKTEPDKKLIKCLQCPRTYHRSLKCIPAGSELLSQTQMICTFHQSKNVKRINMNYCRLCFQGGTLICCDGCVHSYHQSCLQVPVGDHFNCEECESGREPLYGEIVWCKYSKSRWWPAIIVPPPFIPENVLARKKESNQICVFFFGTHNYGWVLHTHMYLYIKGDFFNEKLGKKACLKDAIAEAEQWLQRFEVTEQNHGKRIGPPPYKIIRNNKMRVKLEKTEYSMCQCRKTDSAPCSAQNQCLNVATQYECHPNLCPAEERCENQKFHRGKQFTFHIKETKAKGWGLFTEEDIPIDHFIMEYIGEVIDNVEFNQRFEQAKVKGDANYYYLELSKDLYLDAKCYRNQGRFINHSCEPNAVLKKRIVYFNGQNQIRVGIFALRNIRKDEEITIDYKWGTKYVKTLCQCGSNKCRGHI